MPGPMALMKKSPPAIPAFQNCSSFSWTRAFTCGWMSFQKPSGSRSVLRHTM